MTLKALFKKALRINIFQLYYNKLKCYTFVLYYTRKYSKNRSKPINLDIKETPNNIEILLPKSFSGSENIEDEGHKFIDGVKRYYLIRNKSYCVLCRHNKTSEYIYTRLIPPYPLKHLVLLGILILHFFILYIVFRAINNLGIVNK